jgi:hypothetical protein
VVPSTLIENFSSTFKAYAELEKDTPGQIFGITFKSDGKSTASSEEPVSEKLTQRPKNEDTYYEEHDIKDTRDFKKERMSAKIYFAFGILLAFIGFTLLMGTDSATETYINKKRDETLARQREDKERNSFDEA